METFDIIIIGSGPGGYVAALRAAQLGMKTAVVERAEIGGICANWGCIPTKALLKSAEVYSHIKHSADFGIEVSSASVDMPKVFARSRAVAQNMSKGVAFLFEKSKIEVIKGEAKLCKDKKVEVRLEDGSTQTLSAKHIVIATGARARSLPNMPIDGKKIIGYREALCLDYLPKSMLVVGSGAIGSELAHFYQTMGCQVTLAEYLDNIVPVEDVEVSQTLSRCFKKNGMKVLTSANVEKVEATETGCKVSIATKKGVEELEVEIVLSAAGVVTNIENIGLEEVGIEVERGKLKVDEFYRTNVEGYYAIGDIVPGPALAHVASREAIVCIENIAGLKPKTVNYSVIPGCTYTTPEVASVGLNEKKALEAGYELKIGKYMFMASGKANAAGARDGFVKVIYDAKTHKMLGCHIIGDHVTEMIAEAVMIMEGGLKAEDVVSAIHPHPSLSEAVMEATAMALGAAVH